MLDEVIKYLFAVATLATTTLLPVLLTYAIGSIRDARIRSYAETVVAAAQQAIPYTSQRYSYAASLLAQRFPTLDKTRINALIEASVHALKATRVGSVSG